LAGDIKIKVRVLVLPVEEELQTGVEFMLQGKSTPEDLVKELALAYPLFRQMITDGGVALLPGIMLVVGGKVTGAMDRPIPPGDEVAFFPAIHGG